jgi:hypothetical protein
MRKNLLLAFEADFGLRRALRETSWVKNLHVVTYWPDEEFEDVDLQRLNELDFFRKRKYFLTKSVQWRDYMLPRQRRLSNFYSQTERKNWFLHFTMYSSKRAYRAFFYYWQHFLSDHEIDIVIFYEDISGHIATLQDVCNFFQIPTLYVGDRLSGRFFYAWDFEDWGSFDTAEPLFPQKTPAEFEFISPHYLTPKLMRNATKRQSKSYHALSNFVFGQGYPRSRLLKLRKELLRLYYGKRRPLRDVKRFLPEFNLELKRDFVYFPLHLQPENTVDGYTNHWQDPLDILDFLLDEVPQSWDIVIRENPGFQFGGSSERDDWFYEGLRVLSETTGRLFYSCAAHAKLTISCRCLVTVTGTAGFEGAMVGKPVITFGRAWYRFMPSVMGSWELTSRNFLGQIMSEWTSRDAHVSLANISLKMGVGNFMVLRHQKDVFNNHQNLELEPALNWRLVTESLHSILLARPQRGRVPVTQSTPGTKFLD